MKDKHEEIARALLGLTSRERATAVMRDVYGMSQEEIEPLVGRLSDAPDSSAALQPDAQQPNTPDEETKSR